MKFAFLYSAFVAALVGATTLGVQPGFAERPSSPAELADTARLNSDIVASNAAADERERGLQAQYQLDKSQNDALLAQYQEQLAAYQEKKKQNDLLQEQYREQMTAYQQSGQ